MNKQRTIPKISLNERHLPYRWQEKLIKNQEIGGVFLVFLSGKDKEELDKKVGLLSSYCRTMNYCKALKEFATVQPVEERKK